MIVSRNQKFGAGNFQRWTTVFCLLMVLIVTSAEVLHIHRDQAISHERTPCLICFSVHAPVPAPAAQSLPLLYAVAAIVVPYEIEANSITSRLELFIRPPPIPHSFV